MNLAFWLSIVLAAASCTGLILAGRGNWQGWLVGLATQPVWAWFALVTKSYGLLLVGVMYTTVYAKNLIQWRKKAKYGGNRLAEEVISERIMTPNEVREFLETDKSDVKSEQHFITQGETRVEFDYLNWQRDVKNRRV